MADDDPLRARFNALRLGRSSTPQSPPTSDTQPPSSTVSDLESRFRRLGTPRREDIEVQADINPPPEAEEEVDIDELLKDIKTNEKAAHEDVESSEELLRQAEQILKEHREEEARKLAEEEEKKKNSNDEEGEEEVVDKALDAAKLDQKADGPSSLSNSNAAEENGGDEEEDGDDDDGDAATLVLPSVPKAIPAKSPDTDGRSEDDELAQRLAALTLPTGLKGAKPANTTSSESDLPNVPDEEIESWCIICCDDATLKCLGCDGDLYCADCWNEGHRSEEAGLEERRHKAVVYVKPTGKKKEAAKKRKVAA
jgi:hypothetical protein